MVGLSMSFSAAKADEAPVDNNVKISDVVGYNKGFYIQSPDQNYKLKVNGYVQGLAFWQMVDGGANQDTFRVRRARLKFSGNIYDKALGYEVEYDFAAPKLTNAFIQYACPETDRWVRIGQYKVPFNFEGLASASALQFVDRSIAASFFGIPDQREPGVGLGGSFADKMIEYNFGIFNGEGINTVNANNEFRYALRVVANLMGKHGYDYSDTKGSEEAQVALGVAAMYNDTPGYAAAATALDKQVSSFTGDLGVKYMGFSGHLDGFYQTTSPTTGTDTDDTGLLAQVGYFLMPNELELAARLAMVFPDAGGDQGEYTGGLNYYFDGHNVKIQADYSALTTEDGISAGNDRFDNRVRLQVQVKL
jgi:phosphate-selective porin